jgi:glutamate racemase
MGGSGHLGILDWGIGGVGVYKLIKRRSPNASIVYLSDTGATPYGKMSRRELVQRLDLVVGYLKSEGVTHLVIGCNAASTAIPHLAPPGIVTEGMILPAVRLAVKVRPSRLGLLGGRRTVLSGVYRRALANEGIRVIQRIAQPLSGLIESGDVGSQILRLEAMRILDPLKSCSHVLLACTHYPAIAPVLQEFVNSETVLLDPAFELVDNLDLGSVDEGGEVRFLTSGDPVAMRDAARNAFGIEIGRARRVDIGE